MTNRNQARSTQTVRFRLRVVELDAEFTDAEPPSLTAVPVETTAEVVQERSRPLVKTSADYFPWARKVGS